MTTALFPTGEDNAFVCDCGSREFRLFCDNDVPPNSLKVNCVECNECHTMFFPLEETEMPNADELSRRHRREGGRPGGMPRLFHQLLNRE